MEVAINKLISRALKKDFIYFSKYFICLVDSLYNHGKTVREVAMRCLAIHDHVLVVDDGSSDLSPDVFFDLNIQIIHHHRNLGKGAAIMSAARRAQEMGMTHIVTIDADLQHRPENFSDFKQAIHQHPNDLIVGKRDFSTENIPASSYYGRGFSNFWFRVQTGRKIGDAQSGYRAYPVNLFKFFNFSETFYSFEVEILVRASWAGVRIRDLDIYVYYPPKDERVSHFKLLKDNLRLTHLNTRLTFRALLPLPHKKIVVDQENQSFLLSPLTSIKAILREEISPLTIALSGTMGVILGTLPLIALHTLAILFAASYFRLNKVVALGMSQLCMPPFIPALCIEIGYFMRHDGQFLTEVSLKTLGTQCFERLYEWGLGSLVVAPLFGLALFVILYQIAAILMGPGKRDVNRYEGS